MTVAIAADHAGYPLKQALIEDLTGAGYAVSDLGTHDATSPVDYPDVARLACDAVRNGTAHRAIVVCGSGVGVSIVANKFPGIRAGVCHDHYSAHQAVEHDDMNVLCLGARILGHEPAKEIARAFLASTFTHEERHSRRLGKVKAIEAQFMKG